MKAARKSLVKRNRHTPLADELHNSQFVSEDKKQRNKGETRLLRRMSKQKAEGVVSEDLSKKILSQARHQLEEDMEEDVEEMNIDHVPKKAASKKKIELVHPDDSDEEEEEFSEDEEHYLDDVELNEEDEKALEMFMSREQPQRRTLADIIMEKLRAVEAARDSEDVDRAVERMLDPKVVEVYRGVGKFLKHYRSGKIPKAFKILPALSNWEELLFLTQPNEWSPGAVFKATRIFASNLNAQMAQRFYNLILLPRIRQELSQGKKLKFQLYMALKKSLYKPAAFYKGILLPLAESGTCTLREAAIVGSVVTKVSIPALHSAAALLKLAEMPYSGANSWFIRVLIEKRYALPMRVIGALVNHFMSFANDKRQMPVLWHRSLLAFVQRYKNDLTPEQREALRELLKRQHHHLISDEVRRELAAVEGTMDISH